MSSLNSLKKDVGSKIYTTHAQLLVKEQSSSTNDEKISEEEKKKFLIDRLELYFEDDSLTSKNPRVACVPPAMVGVPCKPLFFDLALNYVDYPDISDKENAPEQQAGGIRGLVKGLWGWGS